MTVWIDEARVFQLINEKRPKVIAFSAPGGLIRQTRELMEKITSKCEIECVLTGDTCFGICDTVDQDAPRLNADMALHIGHGANVHEVGDFTFLIDAVDDIKFDEVTKIAIKSLTGYKKLGLVTFSQHMHELKKVKEIFEASGFEVLVGRGNNLLMDGQIFGCDFSTVYPLRDKVDAFCFMGESEFHAVGLALAVDKPTYMLDPYMNEVVDMQESAEQRRRRAILSVYKALDAKVFGVITGLKEGQKMLGRSSWIAKRLEMHGRKVLRLAMRDITPEKLAPYRDVDAFIQTACPRISIDGFTFDRPVLSIPQADALVDLLEGRPMRNFLQRPKWIELTVGLVKMDRRV